MKNKKKFNLIRKLFFTVYDRCPRCKKRVVVKDSGIVCSRCGFES